MASTAIAGVGTVFKRALVNVAEINSISGPNMSASVIDVTSLDSIGGYKEFISGMRDGGEVSLACNFTTAEYHLWLFDFEQGITKAYSFELQDSFKATISFTARCTGLTFGAITPDERVTCDVTLKVSGAVTFAS